MKPAKPGEHGGSGAPSAGKSADIPLSLFIYKEEKPVSNDRLCVMCCQLTGRKSGPLKQRVARRARSGDVTGGARRSVMRTAVADIGSDAIQSGGRPVFVGVLAAFRLHFNRDTGGNVRGTDSGFCLIHMLAARPL